MPDQSFDIGKLTGYWLESSDEDYETMMVMFNSKRYSWSLFIGHLMMEKLLKAYYVQENKGVPPYLHNLLRLADQSGLAYTEPQKIQLATITAFNLNARYDDYKMSFQKKCTPGYADEWIGVLKELRQWIKGLIKY